jgi:hypothetical protein
MPVWDPCRKCINRAHWSAGGSILFSNLSEWVGNSYKMMVHSILGLRYHFSVMFECTKMKKKTEHLDINAIFHVFSSVIKIWKWNFRTNFLLAHVQICLIFNTINIFRNWLFLCLTSPPPLSLFSFSYSLSPSHTHTIITLSIFLSLPFSLSHLFDLKLFSPFSRLVVMRVPRKAKFINQSPEISIVFSFALNFHLNREMREVLV